MKEIDPKLQYPKKRRRMIRKKRSHRTIRWDLVAIYAFVIALFIAWELMSAAVAMVRLTE